MWTQGETVIQLRADLQTILAEGDAEHYFFRIDSAQGRFLLGEPELATIPPEEMLTEGLVTFRTVDFREGHMRLAAINRKE